MRFFIPIATLFLASLGSVLFAQHAVDPGQRYHRLICLVHLVGSGKHGDPIRPEFVPGPGEKTSRAGIISWSLQPTDDGRMAIIHVVAADPHAFDTIRGDKRADIRVFEIGKDKPEAIENEMKKVKKDFNLNAFKVVAR